MEGARLIRPIQCSRGAICATAESVREDAVVKLEAEAELVFFGWVIVHRDRVFALILRRGARLTVVLASGAKVAWDWFREGPHQRETVCREPVGRNLVDNAAIAEATRLVSRIAEARFERVLHKTGDGEPGHKIRPAREEVAEVDVQHQRRWNQRILG